MNTLLPRQPKIWHRFAFALLALLFIVLLGACTPQTTKDRAIEHDYHRQAYFGGERLFKEATQKNTKKDERYIFKKGEASDFFKDHITVQNQIELAEPHQSNYERKAQLEGWQRMFVSRFTPWMVSHYERSSNGIAFITQRHSVNSTDFADFIRTGYCPLKRELPNTLTFTRIMLLEKYARQGRMLRYTHGLCEQIEYLSIVDANQVILNKTEFF